MKLFRVLLAGVVLAGVTAVAVVSKNADSGGARMASSAERFLAALEPEQKKKATFDFDDKERTQWYFVPRQTKDKKPTRKGLALEEMNARQKEAALDLLKAATSAPGYKTATTIMSLENILRDLEKSGEMVRNPNWYFVTIFGSPSKTGKWGFRFEGHHLSLNFTIDNGSIVSATPAFFGANPATVKGGTRAGEQALPGTEKFAVALFDALDDEQKKAARQEKLFPEIEQAVVVPGVGKAKGLAAEKMNARQKELLKTLIKDYASRLPDDVATFEMDRIDKAGFDKVTFAFARDDDKPGKPYTYRVQGPTFVIEFINEQKDSAGNPVNHIHSAWRNVAGDFAMAKK